MEKKKKNYLLFIYVFFEFSLSIWKKFSNLLGEKKKQRKAKEWWVWNECRFHAVSEFDESKRSCRRRLAGHNERRRKSSHESAAAKNSTQGTYIHKYILHFFFLENHKYIYTTCFVNFFFFFWIEDWFFFFQIYNQSISSIICTIS